MGRYGIDYESVRTAAEAIEARGEAATIERVRQALGSGSFTTLGRHLRLWRKQAQPQAHSSAELPELITDAAQTVWAQLAHAAQQQVAEAQAAAQQQMAESAETAAEQVRAAQGALAEAQRAQAAQAAHAAAQLQLVQAARADLQTRLDASEAQRVQLEATQAQVANALARLQAQHEAWASRDEARAAVLAELLQHSEQQQRQQQAQQAEHGAQQARTLAAVEAGAAQAREQGAERERRLSERIAALEQRIAGRTAATLELLERRLAQLDTGVQASVAHAERVEGRQNEQAHALERLGTALAKLHEHGRARAQADAERADAADAALQARLHELHRAVAAWPPVAEPRPD